MSGTTPYGSSADQVPVRPAPVRTSSATSRTPWRSQAARTRRQYSGAGTDAPVDDPPTGSASTAATVSGSLAEERRLHCLAAAARTERRHAAACAAVRRTAPAPGRTRPASPESRSCSARGRRRRAPGGYCRDSSGESARTFRRAGWPASTQYCRASLSAASTASEPLDERIDQLEVTGGTPRDLGGELLDRIAGERGAAHVGQPLRLPAHRRGDLAHSVAHVDDEGAARGVEVGPPSSS